MASPARSVFLPYLAFLGCVLAWGSTWAAIRVGLETVPPFLGAGFRFTIAGVLLFVVLFATERALPSTRRDWVLVAFVGAVMFGTNYAFIYWAEQWVPSGLASVLFSTMPLWTLLLARGAGLEVVTPRKLTGILVGVAGVAVLFVNVGDARVAPVAASLAVVAGAVGGGAASVAIKRFGGHLGNVSLMAPAMLVGALVHGVLVLVTGEPLRVPTDPRAWGSILYLALVGTIFTFLTFTWLIKRWDASRTSLLTILTPLVALGLGAVLFDEPLTPRVAAGTVLVLAGVTLALRQSARVKPAPAPEAGAARTRPLDNE